MGAVVTRLDGPSPETEIAVDMVKRSLWVAPVIIGIGAAGWGFPGAASAAYGLVLVLGNFLLAAWLLKVTAHTARKIRPSTGPRYSLGASVELALSSSAAFHSVVRTWDMSLLFILRLRWRQGTPDGRLGSRSTASNRRRASSLRPTPQRCPAVAAQPESVATSWCKLDRPNLGSEGRLLALRRRER